MWHTYIIQNFTYLHVQYFFVSSNKHTLSFLGLITIDQNTVSTNVNFFQNEASAINHEYCELFPVYKYGFYQSKMKDWCSFRILLAFLCNMWTWKNEWLNSKRILKKSHHWKENKLHTQYPILVLAYSLWVPITYEAKYCKCCRWKWIYNPEYMGGWTQWSNFV